LVPLNEPQWDWIAKNNGEASQEGSSATNAEGFQVVRELNSKISNKGLTTKIANSETTAHNYAYSAVSNNVSRSDVINYFWNSSSAGYIGSLNSVEKVSSSNSYFSQPDISSLISNRANLANKLSAINSTLNYWQSEYCILGGEDNTRGNIRDLGINSALYIGRVIHTDLAIGNALSWLTPSVPLLHHRYFLSQYPRAVE